MIVALIPGLVVASPGLVTEDLSGPLEPADLAGLLAGTGVTVSNVTYTGVDASAGTFSGGTGIIDFEDGVILSSGNIANVVGPNVLDSITAVNGTPGDADLTALAGVATFDATVLEFDFEPNADTVFFRYVFSSDEYNEFVNSPFNDVFAFLVNGTNCATVNGDPVSINTINNGNPFDSDPRSHPELYRNNDLSDGGGAIDTEMDGLTVVLTCVASVTANAVNHMKLAIADGSDSILDSNVFLKRGSLTTTPPTAGRMTGGGSAFTQDGRRVTHGFELQCDKGAAPSNLEINWGKSNRFHLVELESAECIDEPEIDDGQPVAGFDTYHGSGTGRYNRVLDASAEWTFIDAGEPGTNDAAHIIVRDHMGNVVLEVSGFLTRGNHQAHPAG